MDELRAKVQEMKANLSTLAESSSNVPVNQTRPGKTVREQVFSRMMLSRMGTMQFSIGRDLLHENIKSAPLENPPIRGGMTDTVKMIKGIILKQGEPFMSELKQIPDLLRRIRHLLRVYYDTVVSGTFTAEYKFCDAQALCDIGLDLHEVGLFLQIHPTRLNSLLKAAPGLETFILDEPIDVGEWRLIADVAKRKFKDDEEATDDDFEKVYELEDKADDDFAAFQMGFFYGDVLVAFIMSESVQRSDKARADKAMKKLVQISTSPFWRRSLGDPLTDAMRPIYWTPELMLRFAHAGGLPALIGDWAESVAKEGVCQTAIENLPNNAWNHQTAESLLGVMRELIRKTEHDGTGFLTTPIFTNMMHQIYSRYGLAPFERASTLSSSEIVFYYIFKRLSKNPQKFKSGKDWARFLERYSKVPRATERRHGWSILTLSGRWDCLDLFGCANKDCPERAALKELKKHRVKAQRDATIEARLFKFGADSKACTRCKHVSYCGRECQMANWPEHKLTCKDEAAKGNNEEI